MQGVESTLELQALTRLAVALRLSDIKGLNQKAVGECIQCIKVLSIKSRSCCNGGKATECTSRVAA
jgi:hypothetical protein